MKKFITLIALFTTLTLYAQGQSFLGPDEFEKEKSRGIKGASKFFNNVATVLSIDNKKIKVEKQRSGKKGEVLLFDVLEKEINKKGETSICLQFLENNDSFQKQIQESILDTLKQSAPLTNDELFHQVYTEFGFTKPRENFRTQFERAKKTLKKTNIREEVSDSNDAKDTLFYLI